MSKFHFNIFGEDIKFKTRCREQTYPRFIRLHLISSYQLIPILNTFLLNKEKICSFTISLSHLKFKWIMDRDIIIYNTYINANSECPEYTIPKWKSKNKVNIAVSKYNVSLLSMCASLLS